MRYVFLFAATALALSACDESPKTTPLDGIHLDAENTRALGRGLEPIARMMLGL